ncbi:MAG: MFS transporter [Bacillus sp. (in: firmicutes)]
MKIKKLIGDVPLNRDLTLLLAIGGLYSISVALSNTFVNVYIWKQSGHFYDIGLYNLYIVLFQPLTFYISGRMTKLIDRVIVFRIGVACLTFFYFFVLFAGDKAVDLIFYLGAIQGVGYGFYWLAYNVLTFEITEPENRDFFNGFLGILSSFGGMIGPFLAGYIISHMAGNNGYTIIFTISLLLFAVAVVLSFLIGKRPAPGKFHFWRIFAERKRNRNWSLITTAHIFQGLREGVFVFIVSLFVYISTGSELALGTFGLINAGVGMLMYYLAARFIKKQWRNAAVLIGGIGLFLSVFLLVFQVSFTTLILYGICSAIFFPILLVPYISVTYDVIGKSWKAAEMRVEYIAVRDVFLNSGRTISIAIFLAVISCFDIETSLSWLLIILGSAQCFIYVCLKRIRL